MSRRGFDCFLVHTKIGANRKLRRLRPADRWVYVAGVLALAAESPVRGQLLISDGTPAISRDVALMAGVSTQLASVAMNRLRNLGLIRSDQHGLDYVHDFEEWNPPPRADSKEATRQRKRRQRAREKQAREAVA